MKNVRYEGSVLSSLEELKKIEEDRVAEEEAAVARALEAKRLAHEAALQQARDEAEAKVAAEHAARMALEGARLAAEREARMRVEAGDAAERARAAVALEEVRLAGELEARRVAAANTRPTWMIAVTVGAVAIAAVLAVLTFRAYGAADEADRNAQLARADADAARAQTERAIADMKALGGALADVTSQIQGAIDKIDAARKRDDMDRAAADAKRTKDLALQKILDDAARKKKAWEDERKKPIDQTKICATAVCKDQMKP